MEKIIYFFREPRKTGFSIEGIFKLVKETLNGRADIEEHYFDPKRSRVSNILEVGKYKNTVNHVTGDIYFLTIGLRGNKNIITIHDTAHFDVLKKRNIIQAYIYYFFWFYLPCKKADIITVVSEFTKKDIINKFKFTENKIRVVYNPVKPIFKFSKKNNINKKPCILQIGTGKHKNLDMLIEAVIGLDCHLDIVGWPEEIQLNKLKDNNISYTVFSGLADGDLYHMYDKCDVLYFASLYEGFGMPIIEAQAVGRPVITSNFGAMKEVAGDSAILVDPYNSRQIRENVNRLIADRKFYDEMVEKGIKNIEKFHHEKIANDYLEIYKELTKNE